ncbi:rhomboid family intramembrane serine protease [Microvirga guangxiensis]|uniref:Membrane associated serine protease, rhomboid family n=1 Tax=Microvirga guangxiensis TaxID=549386 RepID=A0A1G5H4E6_9HYPH|nr:rhomboid family intramembrane serine protease [Microvirga guangxiensis]SCY58745.1 Membrane associated serine protease, rhomboid family [Microvirga guangxiensis]
MFLPLHDGVPLQHMKTPVVARSLIVICIMVHLVFVYGPLSADEMVGGFGLIPAVLFGYERLPEGYPFVPVWMTLVTNIFLHGSWFHLIGNLLFLWVFGDNVEDAMGHLRFLLFFLICGIAASFVHAVASFSMVGASMPESFILPAPERPLIGASGGVSGVVAAYVILYPRVRIWALFLGGIPLRLPAYWAIGFWFAVQFVSAFFGADEGVGWFAHLGGFIAGAILIPIMRHRYDPVLARAAAQELQTPR